MNQVLSSKGLLRVIFCLGIGLMVSCSGRGQFPHASGTNVDLSRKNYRVVRSNIKGSSVGFWFLGIIPIVPPTYTSAMSDLYDRAGMEQGTAQALVNVSQERSTLYLILFSLPRLTVRADVIEFVDDSQPRVREYPADTGYQDSEWRRRY